MRNKRIARYAITRALEDLGIAGLCSTIIADRGYMMTGPTPNTIWYYPGGDCASNGSTRAVEVAQLDNGIVSVRLVNLDYLIRYTQRGEYHDRDDVTGSTVMVDTADWIADQGSLLDQPATQNSRRPSTYGKHTPKVIGTLG